MSEISCAFWFEVDEWGHRVVSVFGGVVCLTLLYLIVCTNKRVLADFRLILLFCCLADIQCWVITSYVHLATDVTEGTELVVLRGFNGMYRPSTQSMFVMFWVYGAVLVIFMLPMNCYYRYVLIKRSESLRLRTICFSFVLACLLSAFISNWARLTMSWNEDGRYQSSSCISQSAETILYARMTDPLCRLYFIFLALVFGVVYTASLVLARRTFIHIKNHKQSYNSKTLSLQRQLAKIMVMQGTLPILTSIGPTMLYAATMLLNIEIGQMGFVIYGAFNWIPLVNPLATIIIIKPYRKHLSKIFLADRFLSVSSSGKNSTTAKPATTTQTPN